MNKSIFGFVTDANHNWLNNEMVPNGREAIIWTNTDLLLIEPLGTNASEILIKKRQFSCKKINLNMSSVKW